VEASYRGSVLMIEIDAVLEAGLLTLRLHRKESEKPRRIQVRS